MPTYTNPSEHLESLFGKGGPVLLVTNDDLEQRGIPDIIMEKLNDYIPKSKQSLIILEGPEGDIEVQSAIVDCNELEGYDSKRGDIDHKFHIFGVPQELFVKLSELAVKLYGEEGVKRSGQTDVDVREVH